MRIIEPSFEIINFTDNAIDVIQQAGRNCYQSDPTSDPAAFVSRLIRSGHHTPLEFASATVKIVCDRGVMAELTRHRLSSFAVQSSRYCNYSKDKFGNEISVVRPIFWPTSHMQYTLWRQACQVAEESYMTLLKRGATAQEARSVLPNSLATSIMISANLREFMHIFKLRCDKQSHPQIREVCLPLLSEFHKRVPVLFEELYRKHHHDINQVENYGVL